MNCVWFRFKQVHYLWYLVLVTFACANPVPPTGGPKDLDPPVIQNTIPQNKSLNFNGSEITLIFDEYIKEENLLTQLMITPNLDGNYTYRVNRNSITLRFDEPFDSATTYTLNFREGIKDITEGNVPPNLNFVFSTGDFLDSASIRGTIRSLMTLELLEDITVSMYNHPDTVTIFDTPPRYSTLTNEQGIFVIENIKNGTYDIFCLNDNNRNLTLEPRTEAYGFLSQSLLVDDSLPSIEMLIFNLDTRPIVLQNSRPVGLNFDVKFNKALAGYQILTEGHGLLSNLVENDETLRFYRNESIGDSLGIRFQVFDSLKQSLDTLVYVKFMESSRRPDDFKVILSPRDGEVNKNWNASLELNKPALAINHDSIYFRFDSLYRIPVPDSLFVINDSKDEIEISFDFKTYLKEDSIFTNWTSSFEFVIGKGSIIGAEYDSVKTIKRKYKFKDPKDYGILRGTISTEHHAYFLQLIDQSFEVIKEIPVKSNTLYTFEFNQIKPGTYSIRVLVDENGNGIWDSGNIQSRNLPEKVYLFFHPNSGSQEIKLRANWEQSGLDITF